MKAMEYYEHNHEQNQDCNQYYQQFWNRTFGRTTAFSYKRRITETIEQLFNVEPLNNMSKTDFYFNYLVFSVSYQL